MASKGLGFRVLFAADGADIALLAALEVGVSTVLGLFCFGVLFRASRLFDSIASKDLALSPEGLVSRDLILFLELLKVFVRFANCSTALLRLFKSAIFNGCCVKQRSYLLFIIFPTSCLKVDFEFGGHLASGGNGLIKAESASLQVLQRRMMLQALEGSEERFGL